MSPLRVALGSVLAGIVFLVLETTQFSIVEKAMSPGAEWPAIRLAIGTQLIAMFVAGSIWAKAAFPGASGWRGGLGFSALMSVAIGVIVGGMGVTSLESAVWWWSAFVPLVLLASGVASVLWGVITFGNSLPAGVSRLRVCLAGLSSSVVYLTWLAWFSKLSGWEGSVWVGLAVLPVMFLVFGLVLALGGRPRSSVT